MKKSQGIKEGTQKVSPYKSHTHFISSYIQNFYQNLHIS